MVRKILIVWALFLITISCDNADTVRDYIALPVMIEIHKSEFKKYKKIRENEIQKLGLETGIRNLHKKVNDLDKKIAKRYTKVIALLQHAGKISYAIEILNDIKNYQKKAIEMVIENPELAGLAIKSEIAILKRLNNVYRFIYLHAAIGGKIHLMSIKERLSVVDRVIDELRIVRGISYGIYVKMKYALKGDLFKEYRKEYNIKSYTLDLFEKQEIIKSLKIW